jgi:hypothetical protein
MRKSEGLLLRREDRLAHSWHLVIRLPLVIRTRHYLRSFISMVIVALHHGMLTFLFLSALPNYDILIAGDQGSQVLVIAWSNWSMSRPVELLSLIDLDSLVISVFLFRSYLVGIFIICGSHNFSQFSLPWRRIVAHLCDRGVLVRVQMRFVLHYHNTPIFL